MLQWIVDGFVILLGFFLGEQSLRMIVYLSFVDIKKFQNFQVEEVGYFGFVEDEFFYFL